MKKNIMIIIFTMLSIIIIGLLLVKLTINNYNNKEFDKFDYNKAKQATIKYLNKNENELNKIAKELYVSGESIQNPNKFINYAGYYYDSGLNFETDIIYIKFDIDAQGMLGGQYYGLIYSKKNIENMIIYDENKETNKGNNILIREKIKDNWYFYYDDYDGKVDINKIRED